MERYAACEGGWDTDDADPAGTDLKDLPICHPYCLCLRFLCPFRPTREEGRGDYLTIQPLPFYIKKLLFVELNRAEVFTTQYKIERISTLRIVAYFQ
jgi:hypothetical protein